MNSLLITGGAGFIGSAFLRLVVPRYPNYQFINLDKLTYAGNLINLKPIENLPNYHFIHGDICSLDTLTSIFDKFKPDTILNFAAETHVDRSIIESHAFVRTNVLGVQNLLDVALNYNVKRFLQISTDEVYGSIPEPGLFTEKSPLKPNSPYAASKAGSDMLIQAYHHTHKLNTIITRCSNNYGEFQFPEKFIPLAITRALANEPIPVYGDGTNIRDWIFVYDHCEAINLILHKGIPGNTYNIGANSEKRNIDIAKDILTLLGKPKSLISFVDDRKGHDKRYAIDSSKLKQTFGWKAKTSLHEGLKHTVNWYLQNKQWCLQIT